MNKIKHVEAEILTLDDFDFQDRTVILRVDINSPIDQATSGLADDNRICKSGPTIRELAVRRGARVEATDGRVDLFLVDPNSGHITHLCLRESHLRGEKVVCIPVSEIGEIKEKVVHLKVDKEAVASLPSVPVKRRWR
jgi:3-phosphoglycerate kinase